MEHAINYNNKKNYTAVTDTGVMYPQMLLLFYCHITHHKVITYQWWPLAWSVRFVKEF